MAPVHIILPTNGDFSQLDTILQVSPSQQHGSHLDFDKSDESYPDYNIKL